MTFDEAVALAREVMAAPNWSVFHVEQALQLSTVYEDTLVYAVSATFTDPRDEFEYSFILYSRADWPPRREKYAEVRQYGMSEEA
jgi:hypothetical protein